VDATDLVGLDLAPDARAAALRADLADLVATRVIPSEAAHHAEVASSGDRHHHSSVLQGLKAEARARGLWNLFLPDPDLGAGLTNLGYAHLAELTGRSPLLAPEATNCAAPDTGNMELLHDFGSDEQKARWLAPLLDGAIRSCFLMTEPDVASSDPRNLATRIVRDGDEYVITGRKWWSSGAASPRCRVGVLMGVTDPDADVRGRWSMVLVPMDAPGVRVVREVPVFGRYDGHGGHPEVALDGVRIPATNLVGAEGQGYAMAQARLGPGRIHHCMRLIGMAERALELLCARADARTAFGGPVSDKGVVRSWIAEARVRIDQARLLVLRTAALMDAVGNRAARREISAIKLVVPAMAEWVIDRAIQVHGGAGFSDDTPLAMLWSHARTLRVADGPDEVHADALARRELARARERRGDA
jgi:acyl-CoA dehydrogenase